MDGSYAIEAAGLNKVYRTRFRGREIRAVCDLTLGVKTGTKFGLLGANGAGKTTFVKMLLSAVRPTAGQARLFGRDASDPEARRPVGYLPENHRFPTYLTGGGMLQFYGALSGLGGDDLRRRTGELLELVGLSGWEQVRLKKYSKGMLQRLGLAQAMLHRPRLLVLDEPTDGVDPVGRRQIRDILNGLTGTGVTIFINSHLLSEVESFCDEVAIIHQGRLALEGRVRDLVAGGGYELAIAGVEPEAYRRLAALAAGAAGRGESGAVFRAADRGQLNELIDAVRAAGGFVESVRPMVSTLEDVFIRTTSARSAPQPAPEEVAK